MTEQGILCVVPRPIKALIVVGALLFAYVGVVQILNNHPLGWILWLYMFARIPFYSPDLVIYETGIMVDRFGVQRFLKWDDIRHIYVGKFNTLIYPQTIPQHLRIFFYNYLSINFWRTNYKEASRIIKENYLEQIENPVQRVYE